ncbi:MAG: DNA mismatch repair protein MutS [Deltaproteobacteria bacterium]|nr:DNA mismatch repair protein MutS [Deltaproteobacteria bacterium]
MKTSALETPMMRQFLAIKADYPDAVVFYRMGDFYEMFLGDAEKVAPLLDITLTTRDKGKPDAVPMCGIPVHSADAYIKQLAGLGHRVAICEQVEDPKATGGRRLVKREVVEVVTPGLVGDPEGIDGREQISLVAVAPSSSEGRAALAALDASTGDFRATCVEQTIDGELPAALIEELQRIAPREILLEESVAEVSSAHLNLLLPETVLTKIPAEQFNGVFSGEQPEGWAECSDEGLRRVISALLSYLGRNQPFALSHVPRVREYALGDTVVLDDATRRHLELFENNEDRGRVGTLSACLDETGCALGARRLARWIAYPERQPAVIRSRQAAVGFLFDLDRSRGRLREALGHVRDLERLLAKAVRPNAVPRDLGALRSSLQALPDVRAALEEDVDDLFEATSDSKSERPAGLVLPEALPELANLLEAALVDDPPVIPRGSRGAHEVGYIRPGFRPDLDQIHEDAREGRSWIAELESSEREKTGISTLKVRYHPVHGYSLEVPKSQLQKVPEHYERKQTLASVERFTVDGLREVESRVMGANDRAASLEREVFEGLRQSVLAEIEKVRSAAERVADLDALASLAEVARREAWVRPEVDEGELIEIKGGRHPVVEQVLRRASEGSFVPNDTELDCMGTRILLLTGPNMSGKSTYLRQVALIVLLAQIGSFVPAESARIGVVDRIFTRVGASDRLSRGESTFMVEMRETADILRLASRRSLIILDEIGRGTSTFDGLSIAWAVAEHLHDTRGLEARTLFATHYHELIQLAEGKRHLSNAHFEVREWEDDVIFLRRLVSGGANRSYGIQVARLAGLPSNVILRAREILKNLEEGDAGQKQGRPQAMEPGQLTLALDRSESTVGEEGERILAELKDLEVNGTTPMEALGLLELWRKRLESGSS